MNSPGTSPSPTIQPRKEGEGPVMIPAMEPFPNPMRASDLMLCHLYFLQEAKALRYSLLLAT